jgi:hypothetical protein
MRKQSLTRLTVLLFLLVASFFHTATGQICASNDPSSPAGITPATFEGNNPDVCVRFNNPVSGTYDLDVYGNTVTVTVSSTPCGEVFSWSVPSNIVMDVVIAKGGNAGYNEYDYTGTNPRPLADGNLHTPLNPSGFYADLSHIDFCFHYKLDVTKSAVAQYERVYDWTIEKECLGPDPLTLAPGQTYLYDFRWTVASTFSDKNWKVVGTITIANNTPLSATITDVSDEVSGTFPGVVTCPVSLPYELLSGQSLKCTYTANLPDAEDRINTATVTTSTPMVEGGTATALVHFADPTTWIDECVTIWDDCIPGGHTDPVCYDGATGVFSCLVGPYPLCGQYEYVNEIFLRTNETNSHKYADCSFTIDIPCGSGCTLTQGYWKTHSEFGPAPYDDTWSMLPNGASTTFFLSGKNYYQVLWTPPAGGNVYYILGHQYIAAKLNQLNGASIPPAVLTAYNDATNLFNTFTPTAMAKWKGSQRNNALAIAGVLENYNSGVTGPGHCDEDSSGEGERLAWLPEDPGPDILINAQPNPFAGEVTFRITLPYSSPVTLDLLNANGQKVATVFSGFLEEGRQQQIVFNAADLHSGLYLYRLTTDSEVKSGQVMSLK